MARIGAQAVKKFERQTKQFWNLLIARQGSGMPEKRHELLSNWVVTTTLQPFQKQFW